MSVIRILAGGSLLLLSVALVPVAAQGATLAEVQSGTGLRLCANPEALPFSGAGFPFPEAGLAIAKFVPEFPTTPPTAVQPARRRLPVRGPRVQGCSEV